MLYNLQVILMLRAMQAAKLKAIMSASSASDESSSSPGGGAGSSSASAELLNLLALNQLAYQRASMETDADGHH
jgi:hypothetical protein